MSHPQRSIDDCPFREDVCQHQGQETACCAFLREITGVGATEACRVSRDACTACVESFLPSADDISPVIASLLYGVTEDILAADGVEGCDAETARRLNAWASDCIPLLAPDEENSVAVTTRQGRSAATLPPVETLVPRTVAANMARIEQWAVGVTTAPRRVSTLDACLDSLSASGFTEARLFMDASVPLPSAFAGMEVTLREPQIGAWPSYYLALVELLMRNPHADAFMLVQDDVLFFDHPDLKEYLSRSMWPEGTPAIASLFCPSEYTRPVDGWCQFSPEKAWVLGAEAFVFSAEAARQFISDSIVIRHRLRLGGDGLVHIDDVIGEWAQRLRIPLYFPTPSLVQHIGHVSTLWPSVRALGKRRADRFVGDIVDER